MFGVGEVVPMELNSLSMLSMGHRGVEVSDILRGSVGKFLKDPEGLILQDACDWSWLCDEAGKIRNYNDPKLHKKPFYLTFRRKMWDAGILSFSRGPRGRVGCFCVSKLVDGVMVPRQRLILDCRQVNLAFRAPPVTELGSLSAVADLHIPEGKNMYIAGGGHQRLFLCLSSSTSSTSFFLPVSVHNR